MPYTEPDYKALWDKLKDHMTYLTQQRVTSLHPIMVMDCMDYIYMVEQVRGYDDGYHDGVTDARASVEEWYDPTP